MHDKITIKDISKLSMKQTEDLVGGLVLAHNLSAEPIDWECSHSSVDYQKGFKDGKRDLCDQLLLQLQTEGAIDIERQRKKLPD